MIQFLRGTQSQLNSSSQILSSGQPVFESDTGQLKIGNGSSRISELPYVGSIFASEGGDDGSSTYTRVSDSISYIDVTSNFRIVRWVVTTGINVVWLRTVVNSLDTEYDQMAYKASTDPSGSLSLTIKNSDTNPYLYNTIPYAHMDVYDRNNGSGYSSWCTNASFITSQEYVPNSSSINYNAMFYTPRSQSNSDRIGVQYVVILYTIQI